MAGGDASSLEGSVETPLSRQKIPNDASSFNSTMAKTIFKGGGVMVLIILIRWRMRINW